MRRSRLFHPLGLAIVAALAVVFPLAALGGPARAHTTTLPTWHNTYNWPGGDGYAGWHYATSATDARYGYDTNHGDKYGLWLWPVGGQQYTPNYAEWTYTAPGTTRVSSVNLSFSYRNKLLAHHCIEVGLRTLDGTVISEQKWCQPPDPPDSQSDVKVTLDDSQDNPTSKVLFFRIEFPACSDPSSPSCSKNIPQLDPLKSGAYARLTFADMVLVDDDNPTLAPSGPLWDLQDEYINGQQAYGVNVNAQDAGSGIANAWIQHGQSEILDKRPAPCDPAHHTDALDARICPQAFSFTSTVQTPPFPEGTNVFREGATDVAGNVGMSSPWQLYIDRTPPTQPSDIQLLIYDPDSQTAAIGWQGSADPNLPDGVPGSGLSHYEYRFGTGGSSGDWSSTTATSASISPVTDGSSFDVQVRSVDAVGNASDPATATLVASAGDEPGLSAPATIPDTSGQPTLTSSQQQHSIQLAETDPMVQAVIGGNQFAVQDAQIWTTDNSTPAGALVTMAFSSPTTLQGDWPSAVFDDGGTSNPPYETYLSRYTATSVSSLLVQVDLNCGKVISVAPGPGSDVDPASVTQLSSQTRPEPCAAQMTPVQRLAAARATATVTRHVAVISEGPDAFYNYDFGHRPTVAPPDTAPEGPINLIFWGSALTAPDTKLYPFGSLVGSTEYGLLKTGSNSWVSFADDGYKSALRCGADDHYRVYHDGLNPHFNPYWGYYYISSAHIDIGDLLGACGSSYYGWFDLAENDVADAAAKKFGTIAVQRNKVFLNNVEPSVMEGNHERGNDGRATKIKVCLDGSGNQTKCTTSGLG